VSIFTGWNQTNRIKTSSTDFASATPGRLILICCRAGTDQPECSACHCPLTVKHIPIECPALTSTRNKHFTASSITDLFDNVAARNIINFNKESRFYRTI